MGLALDADYSHRVLPIGTNCKRITQEGVWLGRPLHWQVYFMDMPNRAIQEETRWVDRTRKGLGETEKDVWRHYWHRWEILQETQIQSIDFLFTRIHVYSTIHPILDKSSSSKKMYKHYWIAKLGYIKSIPQLLDHLSRLIIVHMSFGRGWKWSCDVI